MVFKLTRNHCLKLQVLFQALFVERVETTATFRLLYNLLLKGFVSEHENPKHSFVVFTLRVHKQWKNVSVSFF